MFDLIYDVDGRLLPRLSIQLGRGEGVYTQYGSPLFKDSGIKVRNSTDNLIIEKIGKKDDIPVTTEYVSYDESCDIVFTPDVPGDIIVVRAEPSKDVFILKKSFLCAETSVKMEQVLSKTFDSSLFGRDFFTIQRTNGTGVVFLNTAGDLYIKELNIGDTIDVSPGNLVAFETTIKYSIELQPEIKNNLFGKEGMYFIQLEGPGKVLMQTQNYIDFVENIGATLSSVLKGAKKSNSEASEIEGFARDLGEYSARIATTKLMDIGVSAITKR